MSRAQAVPRSSVSTTVANDDGRDHHGNDAEGRGNGLRGPEVNKPKVTAAKGEDADDDEQVDRAGRHPVGHTGHR